MGRREVSLGADDVDDEIRRHIASELCAVRGSDQPQCKGEERGKARRTLKPNLDVSEAILIRDVVHQDGSECTAIIQWRHGPESLLTRRVPDLQPNLARIDDELFGEEAGAYGGGQRVGEVTRGVAVHDGGLADALTADW